MSGITPIGPAADGPLALGESRHDPARVREAAAQFESLLIAQLLQSARSGSTGWLSDGDDQAGATATDMAEEHFAQALAQQGGLGLARMVLSGLERKL